MIYKPYDFSALAICSILEIIDLTMIEEAYYVFFYRMNDIPLYVVFILATYTKIDKRGLNNMEMYFF